MDAALLRADGQCEHLRTTFYGRACHSSVRMGDPDEPLPTLSKVKSKKGVEGRQESRRENGFGPSYCSSRCSEER